MGNLWLVALFLIGSWMDAAECSIHEYKTENFTKITNAFYFHGGNEGLYGPELLDVRGSSDKPPLKGKSFIRFEDILFGRSKESANKQNSTQETAGLVEAILFEVKQQDRVGGSFLKTQDICCTRKLADDGSCNFGEVIITADPNAPEWPKRISTFFKRGQEEVKMSPDSVAINKTGWYVVYFMTCDPELEGITIRGRSVWKNLDGFLPGEKAPLRKFYALMFLAYALLGLVWFPVFFKHRYHRIQLHNHISLVIVLALSELALRYFEFNSVNTTGVSPMDFTFWAVILSSLKMAFSRLLLLVICTGHGVVNPIVGDIAWRMLFLGVICSVLAEALGLEQYLGNFSERGMTIIMLSWAIVENCFVQWTFRALWRTLKKLKVKTNMAKLHIYRMFATTLVIMMLLNFSVYYMKIYFYLPLSEFWQVEWMTSASWYILAYALLALICFFWAPSDNPTRYLYVAEMEEEFEEEENLSLTEAGMKTKDGNNNERKSLVDAIIVLFGGVPGEI